MFSFRSILLLSVCLDKQNVRMSSNTFKPVNYKILFCTMHYLSFTVERSQLLFEHLRFVLIWVAASYYVRLIYFWTSLARCLFYIVSCRSRAWNGAQALTRLANNIQLLKICYFCKTDFMLYLKHLCVIAINIWYIEHESTASRSVSWSVLLSICWLSRYLMMSKTKEIRAFGAKWFVVHLTGRFWLVYI